MGDLLKQWMNRGLGVDLACAWAYFTIYHESARGAHRIVFAVSLNTRTSVDNHRRSISECWTGALLLMRRIVHPSSVTEPSRGGLVRGSEAAVGTFTRRITDSMLKVLNLLPQRCYISVWFDSK